MPLLFLYALAACSAPQPAGSRADLDALFEQLRTTVTAEDASRIEVAILRAWAESGRPEVDMLMYEGLSAVEKDDLDLALDIFDEVVRRAPRFAEGWNMRANIHVLRDEHREAVIDFGRVLAIEPRHFEALQSLGRIFMILDAEAAALHAFEAALEINPYLNESRAHAGMLREQLAGLPI